MQFLQRTASLPGDNAQCNSCNAMPYCLGPMGSATPRYLLMHMALSCTTKFANKDLGKGGNDSYDSENLSNYLCNFSAANSTKLSVGNVTLQAFCSTTGSNSYGRGNRRINMAGQHGREKCPPTPTRYCVVLTQPQNRRQKYRPPPPPPCLHLPIPKDGDVNLCCVVLCCVVLCCVVLCCVVLCCVVLCCVVLCCVVLCCVVLCCAEGAITKRQRPGCLPTGTGKRAGLCVLCARCV